MVALGAGAAFAFGAGAALALEAAALVALAAGTASAALASAVAPTLAFGAGAATVAGDFVAGRGRLGGGFAGEEAFQPAEEAAGLGGGGGIGGGGGTGAFAAIIATTFAAGIATFGTGIATLGAPAFARLALATGIGGSGAGFFAEGDRFTVGAENLAVGGGRGGGGAG